MKQALQCIENPLEMCACLETLLETLPEGIVVFDAHGRIHTASRMLEALFGYTAEELVECDISQFIFDDEAATCAHDLMRYEPVPAVRYTYAPLQVTIKRRNGGLFPAELRVAALGLADKARFLAVVQNVSGEVAIQERLQEELSLQQALLDSANLTIISTDLQGEIRIFNNAAERMLGYCAEDVVGKRTPVMFHDPAELRARVECLAEELEEYVPGGFEGLVAKARMGFVDEAEWTYVGRDGAHFPVLLSITALSDEEARVIGYLMIGTDISERKKVERMKSEFISTVSHELRTPLTSIRGSLGLVTGGAVGELPAKAKPLLEIANKNALRLSTLINDILDIEKIEAGKMSFKLKPFALDAIIKHTLEANQGYADQFKVKLVFDNQAPDIKAEVDQDRLEQVLANLLSNACKFSPPGAEVRVSLTHHGRQARVEVMDHGEGIAEAFQKRIFQKFAQADASDTRQKSGTGLGLSISKAIVEKLHGQIGFHSTAGAGTVFFFELPVWQPAPLPMPLPAAKTRSAAGPVLICEDDPDIATLLTLFLERAGYMTEVADTLKAARAFLESCQFSAMTLDLMLPDGDGLSFLHELRADRRFARLPVIVVSAKAELAREEISGQVLHVMDWLPKPIDAGHLVRALEQALHKRGKGQSGEKPCILHVEDDSDIRRIVEAVLKDKAEVRAAANLEQARAALKTGHFDLVLLDIGLPDGSGTELLAELHHIDAELPVVIFSAQQVPETVARQVNAALTKTRTDNRTLTDTILMALQRPHEPERKV